MYRTISVEVGKGSVNHNSRKFLAANVDGARTHLNIDYCNENIQKVYHELFDEALEKYNKKQTRADRRINSYYDKIRSSKQEKTFHEIIIQIGNRDDTSATGEYGSLAMQVLDEYYKDFQTRNPNLRVFSAHLHMDEATPHLHIDFIPYTTGSKRGLETRVSLKQALAKQGFTGKGRSETEWAVWVQSEKEALAKVMERHDIIWEKHGTHEKHLSVLDYKKQEREKEVSKLDTEYLAKREQYEALEKQIFTFNEGVEELTELSKALDEKPEYQLPEPQGLMSAKAYMRKVVVPLVSKLKFLLKTVLSRCYEALDSYYMMSAKVGRLDRENQALNHENRVLTDENKALKAQNRDYQLLKKEFTPKQLDELIKQAKEQRKQRHRNDYSR